MSRHCILFSILLLGMTAASKADILNFELGDAAMVSVDPKTAIQTPLNPNEVIVNQPEGQKYFNGNTRLDKAIDTTSVPGKIGAVVYNQNGNPSITNFYAYDAGHNYQYWFGFALSQENQALSSLSQAVIDSKDFLAYQYSAAAGAGAESSDTYAIGYIDLYNTDGTLSINFDAAVDLESVSVTNSTYTAAVIQNGNGFANPFTLDDKLTLYLKGITGTDGDNKPIYLEDASGNVITLEFTLAEGQTILSDWSLLDLTEFVGVTGLEFSMLTTDIGDYGANTPYYFALDNLSYALHGAPVPPAGEGVPEPSTWALLILGALGVAFFRRKK